MFRIHEYIDNKQIRPNAFEKRLKECKYFLKVKAIFRIFSLDQVCKMCIPVDTFVGILKDIPAFLTRNRQFIGEEEKPEYINV